MYLTDVQWLEKKKPRQRPPHLPPHQRHHRRHRKVCAHLGIRLFLASLQETIVIAVMISSRSLILIPKSVSLTKIMIFTK